MRLDKSRHPEQRQMHQVGTQMSPRSKQVTAHLTTRYNRKVFGLVLKGLFVLLGEIKKKKRGSLPFGFP